METYFGGYFNCFSQLPIAPLKCDLAFAFISVMKCIDLYSVLPLLYYYCVLYWDYYLVFISKIT